MELTVSLSWRLEALEDRLPLQIANADIKIRHYCAFLLSFSLLHYDFHLFIERERECQHMGAAILILVSQILDSQLCITDLPG